MHCYLSKNKYFISLNVVCKSDSSLCSPQILFIHIKICFRLIRFKTISEIYNPEGWFVSTLQGGMQEL